jgi:TRAP-type C4-dicarboxylate transport system substrate-binding protein
MPSSDQQVRRGGLACFIREDDMTMKITRRSFAALGTAALATPFLSRIAYAADPIKLRFSAVFSDQDIRAEMAKKFAEGIGADFAFEPYYGGALFKQGTELVALQRGNLEMGNIAPQDVSSQVPAWSVLTSGYLFRDANHLRTFFASDVGAEMKALAEDQLGIKILGPTFYGTRQVGLRTEGKITTPADLSGINLRMPGGEAWQFLGSALGANPTPMAYAEVYTGLQTGAIDGQDNPLPNVENMKFYEVMKQIVLTSHLVAFDLLTMAKSVWDGLTPEQQTAVQAAADSAIEWSTAQHLEKEAALAASFAEKGLQVYAPDVEAFRAHVQKAYLESELAKSWPEGIVERIAAL